ncbi:hypothetical protein [Sphingosinicella sp. BN140058]|uniref:hypothetical protein n=1 Tax=Sphingosinicella sp. BN140058 TaxID=1892855 RepID=UPI001011C0B2|nr:hypothetical protein [Sphingosinicella sp. BN140058]QAY80122.1 hypothetical protein ETR14_26125 [Sphingosinicella sp. BN140058]
MRHVDEVTADHGPFTCLGCGTSLRYIKESREICSKRRIYTRRAHFSHEPGAECPKGLETALHRWAKEVIAEARGILLPPHVVTVGSAFQHSVTVRDSWTFDRAAIEEWEEGLRPDVVLYRGDRELHVEILVSHETEASKVRKIATRDVSAVELDLSEVDPAELSRAELAQIILADSPRRWLHHEEEASRTAKAEAEYRTLLLQRGKALRDAVLRPPEARPSNTPDTRLSYYGLSPFVGREVPFAFWFSVPPDQWQLAALCHYAVAHAEGPGVEDAEIPYRPAGADGASWTYRRADLELAPRPDLLAAAGFTAETYGSPQVAIAAYLDLLCAEPDRIAVHATQRRIVSRGTRPGHLVINTDWLRYVRRRTQLERSYRRAAFRNRAPNTFAAWLPMRRQVPEEAAVTKGQSPRKICLGGGPIFYRLLAHIDALRNMLDGGWAEALLWGIEPLWVQRDAQSRIAAAGGYSPARADRYYICQSIETLNATRSHSETMLEIGRRHFCSAKAAARFLDQPNEALGGDTPRTFATDIPSMQRCISLMPRLPGQNGRQRLW